MSAPFPPGIPAAGKAIEWVSSTFSGSPMGASSNTGGVFDNLTILQQLGAEALPGSHAVQGVVATAVRFAGVLSAATARAARQDGADRAELHRLPCPRAVRCLTLVTLECTPVDIALSLFEQGSAVYSPAVL